VERGLRQRADPRVDDLRLYAVPGPAAIWAAGTQTHAFDGLYASRDGNESPGIGARLRRWVKSLTGQEAA
jgi:hypothetical protein